MGRYSRQFKEEAIRLVTEQGYKVRTAASKLGVPSTTLDRWVQGSKPRAEPSDDPKVLQVQLREAQGRLKALEVENEILKKATAYFARENL